MAMNLISQHLIGKRKTACQSWNNSSRNAVFCSKGHFPEMKDAQKAGLIVNWIGRQCIMTLHSMGIALDRPKTVFNNLEKIFRPESNQTLSQFKFRGLKQKQSQTCDSYMSELLLAIVECSFVCVRKTNRKIRLCLDPTHLNKWIIRPRHNSKLVDDILHNLNRAK